MFAGNVEVLVPFIQDVVFEEIGAEPWKLETPIYAIENKLITIRCEKVNYFMTDDTNELSKELLKYKLVPPAAENYRPNPGLNHSTRLKMLEIGAKWSVIKFNEKIIVNYYTKEDGAFIAEIE